MNSGTVHTNEGHEVVLEPLLSEAQVVCWGGEKVETPSAVQMLQAEQVLEGTVCELNSLNVTKRV